jgi:hypothetical protein
MKKTVLALSFVSIAGFAAQSFACSPPAEKPEIPDAATVVTAQMVKANNDVKAYIKATEDYLSCAKLSRSDEKKAIDDLKQFAEEFNVVVRAFKARSNS